MGEKFDKLTGKFKIVVDAKEYPFAMTVRQRGIYDNLRGKMDNEAIIQFLYDRFKEGFLNAQKAIGKDATVGDLDAYESELTDLFLTRYEAVKIEVMITLGVITQEQVDRVTKSLEDPATFLGQVLPESTRLEK